MDEITPEVETQNNAREKPTATVRRGRALRRSLLGKLPKLPVSEWKVSDADDVYKDLATLVELDPDAFLAPLSELVEGTNG